MTLTDPDIINELTQYWRSTKDNDMTFWQHEYNKHGYCWVKKIFGEDNPEKFFNYTLNFFHENGFPTMFQEFFGKIEDEKIVITQDELAVLIEKKFPGVHYETQCNSKGYLTEMRFHYDLDLKPLKIPYSSGNNGCGASDKQITITFRTKNLPPIN